MEIGNALGGKVGIWGDTQSPWVCWVPLVVQCFGVRKEWVWGTPDGLMRLQVPGPQPSSPAPTEDGGDPAAERPDRV